MDPLAHRFLDHFTPAAREQLHGCIVLEEFLDGTYLFQQGDEADGVYLVLEGSVEIVRAAGNRDKLIASIPTGEYFGEIAVLDGLGRSTAARARGPTRIAKVPCDALLEILSKGEEALKLGLLKHVIADLRRVTDQMVREAMIKEKLTLVGEMATSLMHDFRSPLANIRLSADLIETQPAPEKTTEWCAGIRRQCDRLTGMTAELLEFSRGDSKLALARTTTRRLIDEFKIFHAEFLETTEIEIVFEVHDADIRIDAMRMQRVLQNLVNNAVEALPHRADPRIVLKIWVENYVCHLAVTDNGHGIPAEIQDRIFEPFVTHGKSKGIGLGMAIVRNIVTAHLGTITFQTAPDQGTSFLISLPQELPPR